MIKNQVSNVLAVGGGGTTKKNTNTTNGLYGDILQDTKISLPSSNASTGGLYGQVIGTGNNTTPTVVSGLSSSIPTAISATGGVVKPIDNSQNFNSSVIGTAGGLSGSGGNKGGVTDEGVITGNTKVNTSTFNNITPSKTTSTATTTTKTTANSNNSILSKLTSGNFVNGLKDIISRLFGTKSTTATTDTAVKNTLGTAGSGTTYAENIGTGTANADKTETASGNTETDTTETASTENNAGSATESTGNTTESTTEKPLTYAEYMEMLKQEAAESKAAADKEAEIAKERAMVDAQSSYAQNQATYGANAETMAQMGLTGGGYSDYLQAQAYAQKRSDVQQANVVESATKAENRATYRDYVNSINEKLAEKALYEEQLAEQRAYEEKQLADERAYNEQQTAQNRKDSLYSSLWEGVQDTDTTYTAEAIRVIGEEYGLSEAQITTLTSLLAATKAKSEEEKSAALKDAAISDITTNGGDVSDGYLDGLKDLGLSDEDAKDVQNAIDKANKIDINGIIKDIQNGLYVKDDGTSYTWGEIKEMLLQARNDGKGITDEDIANAKSAYDVRCAYTQGKISADEYYNALNGNKAAIKLAQGIVNPDIYKSKVPEYGYNEKDIINVIYTTSDNFNIKEFGNYTGTGKDGKQDNYIKQLVADAQAGKIKEGQYVVANYGAVSSKRGYFVYVGDGVFIELYEYEDMDYTYNPTAKNKNASIYIPDGYKRSAGGGVKKK